MTMPPREQPPASVGLGVDSYGMPVVDPTLNVIAILAAAVKRQDDLREELFHRLKESQSAEIHRIDEISKVRAEYYDKLSSAESRRIDAIRSVDVAAVSTANDRAVQQATILANQVTQSAETLRALVASTASQVAMSLSQLQSQLTDRIGLLEKSQYEIKGRSGLSDPMTEELVKEMRLSRNTRAEITGKGEGMSAMWGYIIAAVVAGAALISMVRPFIVK